ncbi:deleted in lung and esophageal cancer protein 1 isoform X6 [Manis pentadactyla]|uniref:deleted in lung and esophageal cancer protein 1 isoform X6 n=1 Tax=Manis pentadactyla TaxID=143292 RepID=UPI00255CD39E|nr:deleted in lung and esophageal cancer protein 1 isoform X6 [Manis pentadactyla]
METGQLGDPQSAESGSYAFSGATWTPTSRLAGIRSPSQSARLSSMAHSEAFHCGVSDRPRRLAPLREPHLLRLRPTSLRSQDISHLLTGVFRNLYSADVIGEDVSSNLIKARGSKNALHEQFVDELQQIRKLYKQRLDEAEMLERHIIQARARALAEKERSVQQQTKVQFLEAFITLPPVKNIFRRCVDSELLQKHHLICPDDFYSDAVPLCSAPKGLSVPGLSRPTFSSERRSILRRELTKKQEASCRRALTKLEDESDHTMDSLACGSPSKAKPEAREAVKKASPPKNKSWMNHLRVPQRELERLLLARMEGRNHFLKNPRFFPPNTPHGGRSLLFPLKKPGLMGEVQRGELGQSCADTPVFLAKPSVGLFTDYEIGSVYEMVISLQNTTSTSRYLRVLPPTTPYFSLGLGMFPGRGGMVAPGMTCQYIVQFFPDCLGDFDDFISVETQSAHTLLIPLKARRPPPVLTLSPVLDCGYCLIGGMKMTRFVCKNVGFSRGRFCIMPEKSWPPPSFRAVATVGFVEQPPFGILPSVFELAPGQAIFVEVLFLPTSLEKAEQTFIIVCDNCQIQELVTTGIGQLVALDLIYISGEKSQPEPGEFTDLRAQHFICFEPENLQSTARKQLIIRNVAHVELPFHWQIMKLMSGEAYSMDSIKCCPDRETAFSILPEKGLLNPHTDNEFILSFSPHEMRDFHSVLQLVLEEVPQLMSLELENLDPSYSVNDMTVLEIEVKGSVEPFQVLLEPYALIIPGENYIGINVKKDFKMWNNSKSPIKYTWGKISDCHIIEVEPCTGTIEPSEPKEFKLNFIGGVPGPTGQDLLCEIEGSTSPVVLHIEAAFKGPVLVISLSALQFGLLRLGQTASSSIQIRNISPLPATWYLKESPGCLEERHEGVSPFNIEPSGGHVHPLGECSVHITLEASRCQRLQTVLELEVVNGAWSYLPVYAEVQEPYVYLQSSQVEVSNLYLGVPTKATITLINGTLLPTCFHWGKLLGHQASFCTAKVSPRRGTLGPSEERQLSLELTTHTQEELTNLALPCAVSGIKEPLVLGISGKPLRLQVAIAIPADGSDSRPPSPSSLSTSGAPKAVGDKPPVYIRLDWETYAPEDREDRLVELLVFYGPPFPLRDQVGNDLLCPETPESSSSCWSPSPSNASGSSQETISSAEDSTCTRALPKIVSVVLRGHDGVPSDRLFCVRPPQVVIPAGGSSTLYVSFTPMVLSPEALHKVECVGYALGFMSLDSEVERELPGRRRRLQDFAVGPLKLHLHSCVRPAQLSVELDYDGGVEFQHQASDLLPEQPCSGVLSELVSTHHLKLTNTMEIPHYFRLLVAKPFSVSQNGASRSRRAPGPGREPEHDEETAAAGKEWVLYPQENMLLDDSEKGQPTQMSPSKTHQRLFAVLGIETQASPGPTGLPTALVPHGVAVSFSLSLELLSYQKLPADQMPPGVDIQQSASGEKEMVFTQNLLLEYANQTTQMVPLRAIVAVPKLQLSTSWVDFGTCFVNERRVRDVYLMNLSGCRSYWAVLMGQQEPDKDAVAFRVSPSSGLLEARPVNAPPTSIMLQVFFTARSSELYESSVVVAGILGEEACTLRLQGQGSYNERYVSPHPF